MKVHSYFDWQDTCDTLHMVLQMLGKAKLSTLPPQPEWKQIVLHVTATGFSTGLIPDGSAAVELSVDVLAAHISIRSSNGYSCKIPFEDGLSVADYYHKLMNGLNCAGHQIKISLAPQESYLTEPFDKQDKKVIFNHSAAIDYFKVAIAAYDALLRFSSSFRGKKISPSLFWGTFDLTTVLYSGVEKPFPGKGVIEETAFDEQLIEFGFWPGDPSAPDPALFVMAYPFINRELSLDGIRAKGAIFSREKGEYFLPMSAVFVDDVTDPIAEMTQFCEDAFRIVAKEEGWENLDWLTKPLL